MHAFVLLGKLCHKIEKKLSDGVYASLSAKATERHVISVRVPPDMFQKCFVPFLLEIGFQMTGANSFEAVNPEVTVALVCCASLFYFFSLIKVVAALIGTRFLHRSFSRGQVVQVEVHVSPAVPFRLSFRRGAFKLHYSIQKFLNGAAQMMFRGDVNNGENKVYLKN